MKSVTPLHIFLIFLRLGFTSFGGPVAHLAYFHEEFVKKRGWYSEQAYADLVALCQFLPGPASSQVGMAIGLSKAGYLGAFLAWVGFTLPSAIMLILFALGIQNYSEILSAQVLHGLKIVAVAVVAQAVWTMATKLCQGIQKVSIMIIAAVIVSLVPQIWIQPVVIVIAGILGVILFKNSLKSDNSAFSVSISRRSGAIWLIIFAMLLMVLPYIHSVSSSQFWMMNDSFYRAGSLVFGGGHVVLPLLKTEIVSTGLVSHDTFLAGYGAAQAVPGPLFTFAAFLGSVAVSPPNGIFGGMIALIAIFIPSFLLIAGVLPFWSQLQKNNYIQTALQGINAAVVGLLLAALYDPVWTSAVFTPRDFSFVLLAFSALVYWNIPVWLVVILGGISIGFL
ncbi:chromate efflux transporter [Glaesserella sp.]|uniref:chromate efflux transporter n=1 Tax=Glaesserella sp. TaxID=2094731 RepID=UPI0035A0EB6D